MYFQKATRSDHDFTNVEAPRSTGSWWRAWFTTPLLIKYFISLHLCNITRRFVLLEHSLLCKMSLVKSNHDKFKKRYSDYRLRQLFVCMFVSHKHFLGHRKYISLCVCITQTFRDVPNVSIKKLFADPAKTVHS